MYHEQFCGENDQCMFQVVSFRCIILSVYKTLCLMMCMCILLLFAHDSIPVGLLMHVLERGLVSKETREETRQRKHELYRLGEQQWYDLCFQAHIILTHVTLVSVHFL